MRLGVPNIRSEKSGPPSAFRKATAGSARDSCRLRKLQQQQGTFIDATCRFGQSFDSTLHSSSDPARARGRALVLHRSSPTADALQKADGCPTLILPCFKGQGRVTASCNQPYTKVPVVFLSGRG